MKSRIYLLSALTLLILSSGFSQTPENDVVTNKHFIGSTLFILATPLLDPSPKYFQLNYGYRLTPKDVVSFEAITWQYSGPLGRPYGPFYEKGEYDFPGFVRAFGAGLAYKRFLWKGVYAQIHATAFKQNYLDRDNKKIQSGFQLLK